MHSGLSLRLGALLVAVVAVLALSAAVMAAGKPGDSGTSSNYTGRSIVNSGQVQATRDGSNGPPAAESGALAPRPEGSNYLMTP
jgi:hypothetical protein